MDKRNSEIKKLHKKGFTLEKISKKFSITSERVRQIISDHKSKKKELYASIEKQYKDFLKTGLSEKQINEEAFHFTRAGRNKATIIKKRLYIRYMKDKHKLSFRKIGILLGRDHTTIIDLYYGR